MIDSAETRLTAVLSLRDDFSRKVAGVQSSIGRLEKYGGRAATNLARNFERMAIVGATAGAFVAKNIVEAAADFEDAMARVEKTLSVENKTPQNLKAISDGLKELSTRIPITAVELAEIAKQAGQLGIESSEDILKFTELLAKLSKVTELDVTYASENMGKLMTIFAMSADELDHFGQVLVALENSGASTVQEILNVSRRFAAAGKQAGLSADQVAAFSSAITSLGVNPEAGGSALSRIFQRTGVEIAKSSDKAKEFAKFMGISMSNLEKDFAGDPARFFVDFFKKLNTVFTTGTDVERNRAKLLLTELGINNVRDINAVQLFAQGYETLAYQLGIAADATNELDEAARSRFASFASQFQLFQNKLTLVAIAIGERLFPGLIAAMDTLTTWIDEHKGDIDKFAKDLGQNFERFIKSIKGEDISALVGVLRSAVGFAQQLVSSFMSLPPWLRELLIGLYVGNKLTGGVVVDVVGDSLKGIFNQFFARGSSPANPMWVASVGGGPGGPGGPMKIPWQWLAGLAVSATALVGSLVAVDQFQVMPEINKAAGANVGKVQEILDRNNPAEMRQALAQIRSNVANLEGLDRILYDLNAKGIKTHTEGLEAALEAAIKKAGAELDRHTQDLDPNTRQWRNDNPERAPEITQQRNTNRFLKSIQHVQEEARDAQILADSRIQTKLAANERRLGSVRRSTDAVKTGVTRVRDATNNVRLATNAVRDSIRRLDLTSNTTVIVNVDGKKVSFNRYGNDYPHKVKRE